MLEGRTIENAVSDILRLIGEAPRRPGLKETPRRVAEMYRELFSGIDHDPSQELLAGVEEGHHDLVVLRNISFYSMCEHHITMLAGSAG